MPLALNPFLLVRQLQDDMDRLLSGDTGEAGTDLGEWSPAIETLQRDNEYVIRVDLPGVPLENVEVDIADDAVTIRGERREEHEDERDGVYVSEIQYGMFERIIPLPPGAIVDDAQAVVRNGVLEIVVPAPSEDVQRGRRLEVQQGAEEGQGQAGAGQGRQQSEEGRSESGSR